MMATKQYWRVTWLAQGGKSLGPPGLRSRRSEFVSNVRYVPRNFNFSYKSTFGNQLGKSSSESGGFRGGFAGTCCCWCFRCCAASTATRFWFCSWSCHKPDINSNSTRKPYALNTQNSTLNTQTRQQQLQQQRQLKIASQPFVVSCQRCRTIQTP